MIVAERRPEIARPSHAGRAALAARRALLARAALADCRFCAHDCRVNRLAGPAGHCHAGADARVFSAQVEVSDELELIPTFAIALAGCDMRCDFCITGGPSWNARTGEPVVVEQLAAAAINALNEGAQTIMILGGEPTIHLPAALEIVAALPVDAKLVWKTNAHGSPHAHEFLEGVFDVWLADYKFGNDDCALRLARTKDYVRIVRENLLRAAAHSELIVRHLLMPGHLDCCWRPAAEWLAENLPGVKINLRSGFWPAWRAARHAEFRETVSAGERDRAWRIAANLGLRLIK